jgi:lipopolysaccharide biosynthesis glycosyltransferase
LPDIDKIIYFDCDIIVIDSLEELFETDISQYYFAGVEDIGYFYERTVSGIKDRFLYVNTGVLLINCKMWRDEKISDKLFEYTELNRDRIIHHDQDVINYVLKSRTLALDLKWNVQESFYSGFRDIHPLKDEITISITSPSIIHFTSQRKPWLAFSTHPQRHLYLDYLRSSSWKDNAPSTASVLLATFELFMKYWWKHPVFFVKPKFWHQMSQVGFKKVIEPGIKAVFPVNLLDLE